MATILAAALLSAPALDSLACQDCQAGDTTPVQFNNGFQLPQAPPIFHYNNRQLGDDEREASPCPFCFLNMFGLVNLTSVQTLFPSISFQRQALPILLSLHLAPKAKPPQI